MKAKGCWRGVERSQRSSADYARVVHYPGVCAYDRDSDGKNDEEQEVGSHEKACARVESKCKLRELELGLYLRMTELCEKGLDRDYKGVVASRRRFLGSGK